MATFILRDLYNKIYNTNLLPGVTMTGGFGTFDFNNTAASPTFLAAGAHTITHASGDRLIAPANEALYLGNPGGGYPATATFTFTLNINGVISSTAGRGVVLENNKSTAANKIVIGKDGAIGADDQAIYAQALTNIDNNGIVSSGGTGRAIVFDGFYNPGDTSNIKPTTTTTINNNLGSVIAGGTHGIQFNGLSKLVVNNKGVIVGSEATSADEGSGNAIQSFDGTVVLTNDLGATVNGSIRIGWLNSSVINKGVIEGTIRAHMYGEVVDPNDPNSSHTGYIDYNRNGTPANPLLLGNPLGDKHLNNVTETAITINNSGTIDGTDNWRNNGVTDVEVALDLTHGKDVIINSGLMFGDIYTRGGNDSLDNALSGKIYGDVELGTDEFYQGFGAYALDADILTNKGFISGSVYTDMGKDVVTNNGEIGGRLEIGTGNYDAANALNEDYDTLTNTGIIRGNVWTGLGDDTITNSGFMGDGLDTSAWPGDYDAGTDTWTWHTNDITSANKENDNDKDKLTNTGIIAGFVSMGHGADTVTNSNLIRGDLEVGTYTWVGNFDQGIAATPVDLSIFHADDKDTVTNSGTVSGYIWTGLGLDTVTNSGFTTAIYTSDNNRTFTNGNGESITITIPTDAGTFDTDTVTNTGTVRDQIWTGVGDDKIFNKVTGKLTEGGIYADDGADIIENDGSVLGDVHGGRGGDKISNRGTIGGSVYLGTDGALNTLVNLKFIGGSVVGDYGANPGDPDVAAEGNNNVDNSGTIRGDILLGGGTDNVKNLGTGRIEGVIMLGGGIDTFTGNASNEQIVDEGGGDTYIMGAGNDSVTVDVVDLDQDTFDGGAGNDTLHFDNVLGTIDISVNLSVVSAQTIGYVGAVAAQPDKGLNFENVFGGNGNDSLVGSSVSNEINGGGGNDFITGGGGQDYLTGGNGADTFIYNFVTDSTLGSADIIRDFSTVDDTINLDSIVTGANFTEVTDFTTGLAIGDAQWRSSVIGGNTIVEINTDADVAAEMVIYLAGNLALTSGDFVA